MEIKLKLRVIDQEKLKKFQIIDNIYSNFQWLQLIDFKVYVLQNIFISYQLKFENFQFSQMTSRDQLLYIAKITEQTERFEDMLDAMKKVVQFNQQLSIEQRNLLSVAYKNSIGSRRSAWRALSSIEKKEQAKNSKNLHLLRDYKKKIETELNRFCNDIISLLEDKLVKSASTAEAQVFYLKMKGDYYRYISEYTSGDAHKRAGDAAHLGYKAASEKANSELKTTHPIRLGLALNFSVFYYEVLNDPSKACQLAKQAFDDAIADIEHIQQDQYKDATTIMQLIRDNLTLWTSELEQAEDK